MGDNGGYLKKGVSVKGDFGGSLGIKNDLGSDGKGTSSARGRESRGLRWGVGNSFVEM